MSNFLPKSSLFRSRFLPVAGGGGELEGGGGGGGGSGGGTWKESLSLVSNLANPPPPPTTTTAAATTSTTTIKTPKFDPALHYSVFTDDDYDEVEEQKKNENRSAQLGRGRRRGWRRCWEGRERWRRGK